MSFQSLIIKIGTIGEDIIVIIIEILIRNSNKHWYGLVQ